MAPDLLGNSEGTSRTAVAADNVYGSDNSRGKLYTASPKANLLLKTLKKPPLSNPRTKLRVRRPGRLCAAFAKVANSAQHNGWV